MSKELASLTDLENKLFQSFYKEEESERYLVQSTLGKIKLLSLELNYLYFLPQSNSVDVSVEVVIGFGTHRVVADIDYFLGSIDEELLTQGTNEDLVDFISNRFYNINCSEATAFPSQNKLLSLNSTEDKWLLYLINNHNTDDLATVLLEELDGNVPSSYPEEFLQQLKTEYSKLVGNAIYKKLKKPSNNLPTFKEGVEDLVRETIEAEKHLPEGMSVAKNVFEYHDVLGYQVSITIGKDFLEKDEEDEEEHSDDCY